MNYKSIIVEGLTTDELERNLNKKLKEYNPVLYRISSPAISNADGNWVAICIAEPILD